MKDFKELLAGIESGEKFTTLLKLATNVIASVALYITIALAVALIVWAVVIRNRDERYLAGARKTMAGIVIGYSLGVVSTIGSLRLLRDIVKGDITQTFWIMVGLFALVAVGVIVTVILQKKQVKWFKWVGLGFTVATVVYVVVMLCVVPAEEGYAPSNSWLMYLISALLVAAIALLAFFGASSSSYNTRSVTYAAICIALSFALSYVKFFSMPQGGSVTFASLLPLALYSYMFGTRRGVIAGVVYGLLQFIQSPQFYHPMQVLLDYPIAFGAIGVAGIGRKMRFLKGKVQLEFAIGATIAVVLRYVSHVISGVFVFKSWAPEGTSALAYSLAYNSFTMVDLAIVLVMGVLALSSKSLKRIVLAADESELDIVAA